MEKKFILPGSLEAKSADDITCGMFVGTHEWDLNNTLRYIKTSKGDWQKGDTVQTVMERVYDNSLGSLLHDTFERL